MTTNLSKEDFIKLAEAYSEQERYEEEVKDSLYYATRKYNVCIGSMDFPISSDLIMKAVLELLGEDFSYYFYDCNEDFNEFNKNVLLESGTHPNVKDLGGLWEYGQKMRNNMEETKFVAKKYFDYYLEREVVFDNKDECEKFVDEQNKKVEHFPNTWWEIGR
jgi:hypothetical protein